MEIGIKNIDWNLFINVRTRHIIPKYPILNINDYN